jgi:hypothetical protein
MKTALKPGSLLLDSRTEPRMAIWREASKEDVID